MSRKIALPCQYTKPPHLVGINPYSLHDRAKPRQPGTPNWATSPNVSKLFDRASATFEIKDVGIKMKTTKIKVIIDFLILNTALLIFFSI